MANQETVTQQKSTNQVRGQDLKSKMVESQKQGEDFRAANQAEDQAAGKNNPESKNPSPEQSGE